MSNTRILTTLIIAGSLLATACSKQEPAKNDMSAKPEAAEPAKTASAVAPAMARSSAPADASLRFIGISDGDVVQSPVHIEFGLEGMEVAPAGTDAPASGHHHILVDTGLPALGQPIPADEQHVHFGDGSTSTDLELAPGEHTLQLLLGDYLHIPHQPPVTSDRITITVE